jgi:hypothetical protein
MVELVSLLIDLAIISGLIVLGVALADLLVGRMSTASRVAVAFPLGGGALTYLLFLLSWAGMPLTRPSVVIVYLIVLAVLMLAKSRLAPAREPWDPQGSKDQSLFRNRLPHVALIGCLATVFLFDFVVSVGQAYSAWDAAAMWGIKGYGIALEGSIFSARTWGAHALSYPLNIHLLIALFKMLSGDLLPGSKLIFPLFLISTLLGLYSFWTRRGVPREWSAAGCLLLASVPVLFDHATNGYANLATACYLVLATLFGAESIASGRRGGQVLAGIFLGLACWTIVEGIFFSAVVLASLLLARYLSRDGEIHWLHICLPVAALGGVWIVFYVIYGATGSQAMGAAHAMLAAFRSYNFNLYSFRIMFGYLRRFTFDPATWGLLFSAGLLMVVFGYRKLSNFRDTVLVSGYLVFLSTGIMSTALFYLRSFVSEDFYAYLIRGFPRESFQTAIIFAALAVWVSGKQLTSLVTRAPAEV